MLTDSYIQNIKSGSLLRKIRRDFPDEYIKILNIEGDFTFKEKVYLYLHPEAVYQCKKCGAKTKLYRYSKGFLTYCSPQCRGKARPKKKIKIPQISYDKVSYWPLTSVLNQIIQTPNYSKSIIKKEFYDFFCYLEYLYNLDNFNEKIFLYLNDGESGQCIECGGNTSFDASKFEYKSFCSRICANQYNRKFLTGGYNLNYFKKYPEEKNKEGYFYFIRLFDENENFLKIGITKRDFRYRKNEICGARYNVEILKIKNTTLYECAQIESNLKSCQDLIKYYPRKIISGKTECFNLSEKEKIWKKI